MYRTGGISLLGDRAERLVLFVLFVADTRARKSVTFDRPCLLFLLFLNLFISILLHLGARAYAVSAPVFLAGQAF